MQSELTNQPKQSCQWCGGTIPESGSTCSTCGAARPRADLVAPGFVEQNDPVAPVQVPETRDAVLADDEENRARQILKDLDAYIPEESSRPAHPTKDTSDDITIVVAVLIFSALTGGLLGWFVAPPLIYDLFNEVLGIDTDGPEAFRRLGGFIGALVAMLFGSMLVAFMRR
jgi:hypothetical protein